MSQSLVLSRHTGTFPPFTPLNCSGLLWKLLLMSKTIQKLEEQCVAEVLDSTPLINRSCDSQGQKLLICIFVIYIYIRKSLFPKMECTIVANTGYCKQFWYEVIQEGKSALKMQHRQDVSNRSLFSPA